MQNLHRPPQQRMSPIAPKTRPNLDSSPLIIGEVLLDHFPDGRHVLGGAPFNVAWNLQGMGRHPTFVSAVGDDAEGQQIRAHMATWGMELKGLQTSKDYKTGVVQVTLQGGQPSYEIVFPCAYDDIDCIAVASESDAPSMGGHSNSATGRVLAPPSLLYHGSLAWRGQRTREAITQLIRSPHGLRFVDVNIRQPWFDHEWLSELLCGADFIKLNDEELAEISGLPCGTTDAVNRAVEKLCSQYGSAVYFITSGAQGAYAVTATQTWFAAAPQPASMMDTVGAGDGFAAAVIDGILTGLPYPTILDRAVRFAARICELRGATSTDASIYQLD